ncbi:hypothetical protein FQR65_LT09630 [Abscondita terminalis]|nr:hypothetical protein FQR65_LT09630 [Abscondita terminalis]
MPRVKSKSRYFNKLILKNTKLDARIKDIAETQDMFLRSKNSLEVEEQEIQNYENMKYFPIDNDGNIIKMENILKDFGEMRNLAKELSRLDGSTIKEITKRIMFHILTNEVGKMYSWEGQKGKKNSKICFCLDLLLDTKMAANYLGSYPKFVGRDFEKIMGNDNMDSYVNILETSQELQKISFKIYDE